MSTSPVASAQKEIDYERLAEAVAAKIVGLLPGTDRSEFISAEEAAVLTGYSRPSIYRLVRDNPDFPQPTKLGAGNSPLKWRRGAVLDWVAQREGT